MANRKGNIAGIIEPHNAGTGFVIRQQTLTTLCVIVSLSAARSTFSPDCTAVYLCGFECAYCHGNSFSRPPSSEQ